MTAQFETSDLETKVLHFEDKVQEVRRRHGRLHYLDKTGMRTAGDIETVVRAYSPNDNPRNCMVDIVTDFMHFCTAEQVSFEKVLTAARKNYLREAKPGLDSFLI
jgi:hypothetical protein